MIGGVLLNITYFNFVNTTVEMAAAIIEKRYSLDDIFSLLNEATTVLQRRVTIISEHETDREKSTGMTLREAIAMMVAHEMTWNASRLTVASGKTMATKDEVEAALTNNHYNEVAFPVYEHFGINMRGGGRRTRRMRR
jgi:hypothetical protein